ncbi:MAG: efflux RND transporter periplasmic adaptor subunit [Bacteroidetes bacterium]|nr:efflux RND transporter periplasmic adaptor subunit [Bacteroidota bacterium]
MNRKKLITIIIIVVVLAAGVTEYFFYKGKQDTKIDWVTARVEKGDVQILVTATGTVNAVQTVLIGTQVSGVISKINVDFNSVVKKGQVLAVLDTRNLQVALDQSRANLTKVQAQLEQAKSEMDRNKILVDKGLVTPSDYDLLTANYKVAQTTVASAQGDVSKAETNLELATIKSPIDGVVISRAVDVGQTVAASLSTPTLFTVANDLRKMQLQANVDEADIGQIETGQSVFFKVDAYPDVTFTGVVQQLRMSPITVNNVVSYAVMIDAPNDELKLLPGMNADISIITKEAKNVIKIPMAALNFSPPKLPNVMDSVTVLKLKDSLATWNKSLVFVLNEGNISPVFIKTGLSDGIKIEVTEGDLAPKSLVVTGVKQNGVTTNAQTKGLITTPQRQGGQRPPR